MQCTFSHDKRTRRSVAKPEFTLPHLAQRHAVAICEFPHVHHAPIINDCPYCRSGNSNRTPDIVETYITGGSHGTAGHLKSQPAGAAIARDLPAKRHRSRQLAYRHPVRGRRGRGDVYAAELRQAPILKDA